VIKYCEPIGSCSVGLGWRVGKAAVPSNAIAVGVHGGLYNSPTFQAITPHGFESVGTAKETTWWNIIKLFLFYAWLSQNIKPYFGYHTDLIDLLITNCFKVEFVQFICLTYSMPYRNMPLFLYSELSLYEELFCLVFIMHYWPFNMDVNRIKDWTRNSFLTLRTMPGARTWFFCF